MADNKVIIAVAVVAVVAVAAVAVFFVMNNGSSNNNDEPFYFYIDFGDNDTKTGWYTATGSNTDDALAKAVEGKGITLGYSKYGYPNFNGGTWSSFAYTWKQINTTTADESVGMAYHGSYDEFLKSNGWLSYAGYGDGSVKKMDESESNVFYFSKYIDGVARDPTQTTLWKNASGSPFTKGIEPTYDYKYYFYIYFGDNNTKTGWYSASAKNTDDALAKAVEGKGITVTYSYGYPNFDSNYWSIIAYTWCDCNTTTADESVKGANYGPALEFVKSNGWVSFAGYGDAEKKMNQSNSYVFFFSAYDEMGDAVDPTETELWKTASGSPFKA